MTQESNQAGFGARLLIILYALGVVMIGIQPLKRRYGSIVDYLRDKTAALAGEISNSPGSGGLRPMSAGSTVFSVSGKTVERKTPVRDASSKSAEEPLDRMTSEDKAQLDRLIQNY